ncbi:hypothetical protein AY600_17100 [Phormidium willei BDU 130791]|nr:hypothetical protein AY600_17100 [Phormidium willei BDU 130791]
MLLSALANMSEPLETLESSLGVDPVLLTPPNRDQPNSPSYLPDSPTLAGEDDDEMSQDFSQDDAPLLQRADLPDDESFPNEDRLDPQPHSDDESLNLEAAMEDEAAVLRSGRGEDFSDMNPLNDESSETLHPIL